MSRAGLSVYSGQKGASCVQAGGLGASLWGWPGGVAVAGMPQAFPSHSGHLRQAHLQRGGDRSRDSRLKRRFVPGLARQQGCHVWGHRNTPYHRVERKLNGSPCASSKPVLQWTGPCLGPRLPATPTPGSPNLATRALLGLSSQLCLWGSSGERLGSREASAGLSLKATGSMRQHWTPRRVGASPRTLGHVCESDSVPGSGPQS